jgi:hypothetical protein
MGNATATASSRKGAKDAKNYQELQLRVGFNGNCNGSSRKGAKDRKELQLQRQVGVNGNCYGYCNGASRPSTALRAGAGAKAQRTAKNGNGGLGLTATATATAPLAKAQRTQRTTKNGNCELGLTATATATAPLAKAQRRKDSQEWQLQRRVGVNGNCYGNSYCNGNGASRQDAKGAKDRQERQLRLGSFRNFRGGPQRGSRSGFTGYPL